MSFVLGVTSAPSRRDRAASRGSPGEEGLDPGAEGPEEPSHLHVVRELEQDLVAGFDEAPHEQEIGLRRAGRGQDLLQADARVETGDPLAKAGRAVRLGVAELDLGQGLDLGRGQELLEVQGMDAAFGEIVVDDVLPRRLHALHLEDVDVHGTLSRAGDQISTLKTPLKAKPKAIDKMR